MKRNALLAPLAAIAVAVATIGGCASDKAAGSNPVEFENQVFSEEIFPEGAQFGDVHKSRQFYVDLERSLEDSKFVPIECKELRIDAAHRSAELASQTRRVVTPTGNRYAVSVFDGTIPRELLEDTVSGPCAMPRRRTSTVNSRSVQPGRGPRCLKTSPTRSFTNR